jgi:hypothetical protein
VAAVPAHPPFAEYTSGHSTFSNAAAEVLRSFTGSDSLSFSATVAQGSIPSSIEIGMPTKTVTLSCTIDPAGLRRRADQLDSLVRQVLERRRDGSTLTLEFPAQAAQEVRAFVVEESRCCPFLSFEVDEVDQRLRLGIRTPPGRAAMLDALHAAFAGDTTKLHARFQPAT